MAIPTVGRIVHYAASGDLNADGTQREPVAEAALVINVVTEDVVDLAVFGRLTGDTYTMFNVPRSGMLKLGHWSWPRRID